MQHLSRPPGGIVDCAEKLTDSGTQDGNFLSRRMGSGESEERNDDKEHDYEAH